MIKRAHAMKDKGKILVLFLIGSEAFFFIALIIAYVYYRNFTDATDMVASYLNVPQASVLTTHARNEQFYPCGQQKTAFEGQP